jgi:hypothetical protein
MPRSLSYWIHGWRFVTTDVPKSKETRRAAVRGCSSTSENQAEAK